MTTAADNKTIKALRANPDWAKVPLFDRKVWKRFRVDQIAENIRESVMPSPADSAAYIGLEHMDTGSLHVERWGSRADLKGQKLRMRKGDVLFARRNAYLRRVAIAPHDGLFSAHGMILRAKRDVALPEFLPLLMMSNRFMSRAEIISVGSLSPTINWTTLKLEEFVLPSLAQQRRIAEILWAVDRVRVEYQKSVRACLDARDSRLTNLLGHGENGSRPRFKMKPLREIASLQTGIAKGKTYSPEVPTIELPYLRVANVQDGRLDSKADKRRFLLQDADVVICEGGDFDQVGRGTIWCGQIPDCVHQNHIFCLRADRSVLLPEFLALQLGSPYGKRYFLGCAKKTSNLASINSTQVKAFPFQLPTLAEQREFVSEFNVLESARTALESHVAASRGAYDALTEAFT